MCAWQTSAAVALVALCAITPAALAQLIVGEDAIHERLEVTIGEDGSAHVLHEVRRNDGPVTLVSVEGTYENIRMTDGAENEVDHAISTHDGGFGVTIFEPASNTIVEYDLVGALSMDGTYTSWKYSYPTETLFVMPQGVARAYINGAAVDFDNGRFLCHGCYADIEYGGDERIYSYTPPDDDDGERIEVRTVAGITDAGFDANANAISMELDADDGVYVDVAIPKSLMDGPYEAYGNERRLVASVGIENMTHSWLQIRGASSGTLNIFGGDAAGGDMGADAAPDITVGIAAIVAGAAGLGIAIAVWSRRRQRVR